MAITIRDARPGDAGRLIALQVAYYSSQWNFPAGFFEAKITRELGEFLGRLDDPRNRSWRAESDGQYLGGITIDGSAHSTDAHLRWFILDDAARGQGAGQTLMDAAMDFCRNQGFSNVHLETFAGLDAAQQLYKGAGFRLVNEYDSTTWGKPLTEQRFEWTPDGAAP